MNKEINITTKKFGRLVALRFDHKNKFNNHYWLFQCDCGKEKIICKNNVVHGHTKSCGCIPKFRYFGNIVNITHGMTKTRIYNIWKCMKRRCYNINHISYKNYGARGIKICDRWSKFENFRDDMYQSYLEHVEKFGEKQTTIDRKECTGNYELNNCKWSTYLEQAKNRRTKKKKLIISMCRESLHSDMARVIA